MKNIALLIGFFCLFSAQVHAGISSSLRQIVNFSSEILGIQRQMLNSQNSMTDMQRKLLHSQQDINGLMRDVKNHLSGNSGWGTYQFHDHQSYGSSGQRWEGVIDMAARGTGIGSLGEMISKLNNEFPADYAAFNKGVNQKNQQNYYALKTKTVLASRAASQLDYNKIQDQIEYQQMLQQNIEKTEDLKSAVDLSNRINAEGNLINLEILRQIALLNQQKAINGIASVNSALTNARFLSRE